jgi:hypothetical protein
MNSSNNFLRVVALVDETPNAEDFRGKSPEEIDRIMKQKGWKPEPSRDGGTRYPNPTRRGDQIRVEPGNPKAPDPAKKGPYIRSSKNGEVSPPVPLKGNPTLK